MSATKSPVKHTLSQSLRQPLSHLLEHGKPKGTAVVDGLRDFAFEIGAAVVGAENDWYVRVDENSGNRQDLLLGKLRSGNASWANYNCQIPLLNRV